LGVAHTSRATAQRELTDLIQKGILIKLPGGDRRTSYDLDWEKCRARSALNSWLIENREHKNRT